LRNLAKALALGPLVGLILWSQVAWLAHMVSASDSRAPSGGAAIAHHADGRRVDHEGRTPIVHQFRTGLAAAEPTIGFTRHGDLFFSAMESNTRIEVLRSGDKGRQWDIVSPRLDDETNAHLLSFDPYLYVDERTSRVFNVDLTVACSYLSYSDDRGESWATNPLACGRPINDHQTLFAGRPVNSNTVDYSNVVYYCWNDVGTSSCSKSLDGGESFAPTGAPAFVGVNPSGEGQTGPFCGGVTGHGSADTRGTIYLPKAHCEQPWLAISDDEGTTWSQVQVADIGTYRYGSDPSVAVDKRGTIYYLWIAHDRLPYLTVSSDRGQSWSRPMMVGAPGLTEADLPSLDVGKPGHIALAYYGSRNSPFRGCEGSPTCEPDLDYSDAAWSGYVSVSTDALSPNPLFLTGTVNDRRDPLVRGACGPGRCSAVYDFIDVEIAPDGTAWAAYVDAWIGPHSSRIPAEGIVGRVVGTSLR